VARTFDVVMSDRAAVPPATPLLDSADEIVARIADSLMPDASNGIYWSEVKAALHEGVALGRQLGAEEERVRLLRALVAGELET
jgi:hypothetical protein